MSTQYTPMEIKAARILCERSADACGVDRDDNWNVYAEDFKADAKAMLAGCGASDLLQSLQEMIDCYADELLNGKERPVVRVARAAIAKATGAA